MLKKDIIQSVEILHHAGNWIRRFFVDHLKSSRIFVTVYVFYILIFFRICRQKVHQAGSHYCQSCAYKKGICAMCGKKLLDIKNYRQSSA